MAFSIKRSQVLQHAVGDTLAAYLKLVKATSRVELVPGDLFDVSQRLGPAIIAMWHGEHFLAPLVGRMDPSGIRTNVLISRSADGEINARAAERWGIGTVRGSGTFKPGKITRKGGVSAFLGMLDVLERGEHMALTADVPKKSRVAGPGIIALARKSGRPILPLAVASSRFIRLKSWDRAALNLPFSRLCFALGEPIWVPGGADEATLEERRESLTRALDETTALAYQKVAKKAV